MIYPWQTHDYPVTTRDILGKTRVFGGKPGFVQPVIYPWQTRDLPVTTRDFFTGSNVPPIHWKYWVKCHFFCEKMGFLRRSIRVVCMFDSKNSNFSAIAGCPQKRFRNQFSDRLLCMIEKKSMQFAKLQCSCYINSWSISEFKNSYHHDPPHQCAIWDPFSHLSFSNFDGAQVGMSTSNRWSCTTLGAGLKHVDDAAMAAEEKQLLAELEDPRMMIFLKKHNCWNDDPTAFCRHTSLGQFLDSSEPFEGFRYADQPEEQPTCPFLNSNWLEKIVPPIPGD